MTARLLQYLPPRTSVEGRSEDHTPDEKRPKGNYECVELFFKLMHVECTYMSKASRERLSSLMGSCKLWFSTIF